MIKAAFLVWWLFSAYAEVVPMVTHPPTGGAALLRVCGGSSVCPVIIPSGFNSSPRMRR